MLKRLVDSKGTITVAGSGLDIVERRCLKIGNRYGFVYGSGAIGNFLHEYYASSWGYGPIRAGFLLTKVLFSALASGPFAKRIFRRQHGEVFVDGEPMPWRALTGIIAGTVKQVGMGFRLNQLAHDELDRFNVTLIHAGALALIPDLAAVRVGMGIRETHAKTTLTSEVRIQPQDGLEYTIDGDLYQTEGPLVMSPGPVVRFLR